MSAAAVRAARNRVRQLEAENTRLAQRLEFLTSANNELARQRNELLGALRESGGATDTLPRDEGTGAVLL